MCVRLGVGLVVALCAALAVPAFGAGPPVLLATWGDHDEVGPHVEGIAARADGSIAVADRVRNRVVLFDAARRPAGGFAARDPRDVTAVPRGGLLIAERGRVRLVDMRGGTLMTYRAVSPYGLALAGDTVLIADAAGGRILRYELGGERLEAWDARLAAPRGLAVGPDGSVYAADEARHRIERFGPGGARTGGWWVHGPQDVAVDAGGTVYVADEKAGSLRWYTGAGSLLGSVSDGLERPRAVTADCRGTVTVADDSVPRLSAYGDPAAPPPPCTPAPRPDPPPPPPHAGPVPPAPEQPALGRTTAARPVAGTVLVGGRPLTARKIVPLETEIDATNGSVELVFETAAPDRAALGPLQAGTFHDGAFTIHQGTNDSLVELRLVGATARRKHRRVRGTARGEFRTVGRHGAATVRGTRWLIEDRATGTFIKVTEGVVLAEALERGERRLLRAAESFLARPACVSRRNFRIRLRLPVGTRVRAARVTVDGRHVRVSRGARYTAPVDLRGTPKGLVQVRIRVRTATGAVLTETREYETCAGARSRP